MIILGEKPAHCEEPGCEETRQVTLVLSVNGGILFDGHRTLGGWQRVIMQRPGVDPPVLLRCPTHKLKVATAGIVLIDIPLPEPVVASKLVTA